MSRCILAALLASVSVACASTPNASRAPVASPPYDEARVESEYRDAAARDDGEALLQLGSKAPGLAAGARATDKGFSLLAARAEEAARRCEARKAEGVLSVLAPYALDDRALDARFDELKAELGALRARCELAALDHDVAEDERGWDWPAAFARIDDARDLSAEDRRARRAHVKDHWLAFVDGTLESIVQARSARGPLGDRLDAWRRAMEPAHYPSDVAALLQERAQRIAAIELVFVDLVAAELLEPPLPCVTDGATNVRTVGAVGMGAVLGRALPDGIPFHAVARGRLDGVEVLVSGEPEADLVRRLESMRYVVPAAGARRGG
jgi:hypothetical protein